MAMATPETGIKVNSKPDFNKGDASPDDRLAEAVAAGIVAARDVATKAVKIKRAVTPQGGAVRAFPMRRGRDPSKPP